MKGLLYAAMLMPAIALASPTVQQVESAIQRHNYVEAEAMLEQVVKENPDSAKAHYYLGQIYNINGDTNSGKAEISQYYAMTPKSVVVAPTPKTSAPQKADDSIGFIGFMFWFTIILCAIFLILFNHEHIAQAWRNFKKWIYNRFNAEDIAKAANKRTSEVLAKCNEAKRTCRSSMTMLKVNGLQDTEIYDAFKELYDSSVDAIECLVKGDTTNINSMEAMLRDVDTWCRRLDDEMRKI